ncbi:MAG: helix-turn-helix domain-containing protein [Solirubrobacteraceae bacterium]
MSSEDAVLAALGEGTATAAELAEQAGLGRSTVSKLLAALERGAKVQREAGGRDGARQLPAGA